MELHSKHARAIFTLARIYQELVRYLSRVYSFVVNPRRVEAGGVHSGGTSTYLVLDLMDVKNTWTHNSSYIPNISGYF